MHVCKEHQRKTCNVKQYFSSYKRDIWHPQHVNVILSIKKWFNFRHGPLRFKQFAKKTSTWYCWKSWLSVYALVRSHRSKRSCTVLLNSSLFSVDFVDTNFKWYEFQVYESNRICNKLMSSESLQVIITLICKGEK